MLEQSYFLHSEIVVIQRLLIGKTAQAPGDVGTGVTLGSIHDNREWL